MILSEIKCIEFAHQMNTVELLTKKKYRGFGKNGFGRYNSVTLGTRSRKNIALI